MNTAVLLISLASIILALKATLGILGAFKKNSYFSSLVFFLLYIAIGIITGLLVERVSFNELASFILRPPALFLIAGLEILIAIGMIVFGLGKLKNSHFINRYEKYFSLLIALPCPFTLVFIALTMSYFQKVLVGISNMGISVGCIIAYFLVVGLVSTLALRSKYWTQISPKLTIMLGILFITMVFFLPSLLSNQDSIPNRGGIMHTLTQILYLVSNAHLIPVIIALILLFGLSLILLGRQLSEYLERKENAKKVRECWQILEEFKESNNKIIVPEEILELFKGKCISGYLGKFLDVVGNSLGNELKIRKIIDDLELDMSHRVERMVLTTRIGPMLGLMGTLIPMGPALTHLAAGNLGEMANQMIVAFATTVLGLTVGGVAYFISLVQRRWYLEELNNIEYLSELIISHLKKDTHQRRSVDNGKELSLEAK
jgi:biopolymer transport protein ExbB/TolQ